MANTYGGISMMAGIASSLIGGFAERKAIKAQNKVNIQNWNNTYKEVRVQLGVLHSRTVQEKLDINRDKIRTQMGARVAARRVKGTSAVKAAQMNIQGRRASRDIYVSADREAANQVSDAEINSEVQMRNATNRFNDTARSAINNLNAQAPLKIGEPSILGILADTTSGAIDTYKGMSSAQQNDFKGMFPKFNTGSTSGATVKVSAPQINALGGK